MNSVGNGIKAGIIEGAVDWALTWKTNLYINSEGTSNPIDNLIFDSKQVGKKWGKHKFDYPDMTDYNDYMNKINDVFNNADDIIYDMVNGEYYYIKGQDLLRVSESGEFISLYPGAESQRVLDAINNLLK